MTRQKIDFSGVLSRAGAPEARKADDVIFRQGDRGKTMYLVKSGEVALKAGDPVLATVAAGGVFGEMALLDDAPPSATAIAATDCEIVAIDERRFVFLVSQTPFFALNLLKLLERRLRAANQKLEEGKK